MQIDGTHILKNVAGGLNCYAGGCGGCGTATYFLDTAGPLGGEAFVTGLESTQHRPLIPRRPGPKRRQAVAKEMPCLSGPS